MSGFTGFQRRSATTRRGRLLWLDAWRHPCSTQRRLNQLNRRMATGPHAVWKRQRRQLLKWRLSTRPHAMQRFVIQAATVGWNLRLLSVLLEELHVDELFIHLMGTPERLPRERYPQAVAVAIALRHSWRSDDFYSIAKRLGVSLPRTDRRHAGVGDGAPPRGLSHKRSLPRLSTPRTRRKR